MSKNSIRLLICEQTRYCSSNAGITAKVFLIKEVLLSDFLAYTEMFGIKKFFKLLVSRHVCQKSFCQNKCFNEHKFGTRKIVYVQTILYPTPLLSSNRIISRAKGQTWFINISLYHPLWIMIHKSLSRGMGGYYLIWFQWSFYFKIWNWLEYSIRSWVGAASCAFRQDVGRGFSQYFLRVVPPKLVR